MLFQVLMMVLLLSGILRMVVSLLNLEMLMVKAINLLQVHLTPLREEWCQLDQMVLLKFGISVTVHH